LYILRPVRSQPCGARAGSSAAAAELYARPGTSSETVLRGHKFARKAADVQKRGLFNLEREIAAKRCSFYR
jgi:hypothetical protein